MFEQTNWLKHTAYIDIPFQWIGWIGWFVMLGALIWGTRTYWKQAIRNFRLNWSWPAVLRK